MVASWWDPLASPTVASSWGSSSIPRGSVTVGSSGIPHSGIEVGILWHPPWHRSAPLPTTGSFAVPGRCAQDCGIPKQRRCRSRNSSWQAEDPTSACASSAVFMQSSVNSSQRFLGLQSDGFYRSAAVYFLMEIYVPCKKMYTLQEKNGCRAPFLSPPPLTGMGCVALPLLAVAGAAPVPWPGRFPSAGRVPVPVGPPSQTAALLLVAAQGRIGRIPWGNSAWLRVHSLGHPTTEDLSRSSRSIREKHRSSGPGWAGLEESHGAPAPARLAQAGAVIDPDAHARTQPGLSITLHHTWLAVLESRCSVLSNPSGNRSVSLCCGINYGRRSKARESDPGSDAGLEVLQMNLFQPKTWSHPGLLLLLFQGCSLPQPPSSRQIP